jgi:hypothetical protein
MEDLEDERQLCPLEVLGTFLCYVDSWKVAIFNIEHHLVFLPFAMVKGFTVKRHVQTLRDPTLSST